MGNYKVLFIWNISKFCPGSVCFLCLSSLDPDFCLFACWCVLLICVWVCIYFVDSFKTFITLWQKDLWKGWSAFSFGQMTFKCFLWKMTVLLGTVWSNCRYHQKNESHLTFTYAMQMLITKMSQPGLPLVVSVAEQVGLGHESPNIF